jgi:hypothetical protein
MGNEFLVQMDASGTIVLPEELRTDLPAGAMFSVQRTDGTIVLKPHVPGERTRLPETTLLEQITLPAEIVRRPGIQHMLSYMATCEVHHGLASDEFYQRYMSGELVRDGDLAYWATCYQTLHAPGLATDAAWLDALDAIAETANTIDFGDSLPAVREVIEAPELDPLHTGLLLAEQT